MESKPFRFLVALNTIVAILAILTIISGKAASSVYIPGDTLTPADFDQRLAGKVGDRYTTKMHTTVVELIKLSDDLAASAINLVNSNGRTGCLLGIILLLLSLGSLFVLFHAYYKEKRQNKSRIATLTSPSVFDDLQ